MSFDTLILDAVQRIHLREVSGRKAEDLEDSCGESVERE